MYGFADGNPVNEMDPNGTDDDDPTDAQINQLSLHNRINAFKAQPQFQAGSQQRRDTSNFLSLTPIGGAMAAHQAITGHDVVAGTKLSPLQRALAFGAAALAIVGIHGAGEASQEAKAINWNWNSRPTWGHTFETHGAQEAKNLIGRAAGTGQIQGNWLNNVAAAEFLKQFHGPKGGTIEVDIPEGLGQLIHPNGSFTGANRARIIFNKNTGNFKSAFPIP